MAVNNFFSGLRKDWDALRGQRYNSGSDEARAAISQSSRRRRSTLASYSGLLLLGLIAAWVMINLSASQFSAKWNIDASDDQLYSLSDTTKGLLAELDQEVTIYALFSEGRRPKNPLDVYRYLELYAASSPYIQVEEIDLELEPERVRPFITGNIGNSRSGRGANKAPKPNSLIVFRPGERFRVIHYDELYYVMQRFGPRNAGIRAEQQISSAIAYVNGANLAQLGLLQGHREQRLEAAGLRPNFEQFNIEARPVKLPSGLQTAAPQTEASQAETSQALEEVQLLLAYKPQVDLSAEEYQVLRDFLEKDGKALWLILDFQAEQLPYFYRLARDYGIEILEGLVLERDPQRVKAGKGYTTFVTPLDQLSKKKKGGHQEGPHPIIKPLLDNKFQELLWSQSMAVREVTPHPKRLRFYSLVESSESSLLRRSRDPSSSSQMTDDILGPLTLLGLSVWQNEQGKRAGPAVMVSFDAPSSRSIFQAPSNLQLFYRALAWLGDSDGDAAASQLVFPSKSLLILPLSLSSSQAIVWGSIFVVLLPLLILIPGLLLLQHRKRM